MSGEINKSVENEMSEIKRLTVKAKRTLLDYFGYATWEDAREGMDISKRKKSKGVFKELKTEYNENIENPRRTIVENGIDPDGDVYDTMNELIKVHKRQTIRVRMYADEGLVFDRVYSVPVEGFNK